ncbi:MAG: T9SS type A sorting domain-containing protein [Nitrospira sp.]|nr:T9SS type A sorting domain-containing protein [Nitrospira sp.]
MKNNIYKSLISGAKQGLFALALAAMPSLLVAQATYSLNYTGSVQTLNLQAGPYQIECWGGNGGDGGLTAVTLGTGGKSGYSKGVYTINAPTTLYIYVGGKGQSNNIAGAGLVTAPGGWNGGGGGWSGSTNTYFRGGGGGASHVATTAGILSTMSGNQSDILIVAGGGGGSGGGASAAYVGPGGNGGGLSGQNGLLGSSQTTHYGGGGTQSAGGAGGAAVGYIGNPGSFGLGGNGGNGTGNAYPAGGGGGGWYGGGGGCIQGGSGGGGSSYIGGVTGGVTYTLGASGYVPNPDVTGNGYVIITQLAVPCAASIETPTITGSVPENSICLHAGEIENFGVVYPGVAYIGVNYNWLASSSPNGPFSSVGTTGNPGFTTPGMGATAVYYKVEATCVSAGITVSSDIYATLPNPTIALSSVPDFANFTEGNLTVCSNYHYTVTAGGAVTYTWTDGAGQVSQNVNPYILTPAAAYPDYTVTATSAEGCTDTDTMTIVATLDRPVVSIITSTTTICKGASVSMIATGNAMSYTWAVNGNNTPATVITPAVSGAYVVNVSAANGCTNMAVQPITVNPLPDVAIVSSNLPDICKGELAKLQATGAQNYEWISNYGSSYYGDEIFVNPDVTTTYSVIGTSAQGCVNTSTGVEQKVHACVGINELGVLSDELRVYPNPSNGAFTIELNNGGLQKTLELFDLTGRKVLSNTTSNDKINLDVSELQNGIYFLNVKSNTGVETVKIVKQ